MSTLVSALPSDLRTRLLDSSIDAYVLALETVNHISVRYRFQSFIYLLCNAWELMLKAHLIDKAGMDDAVYYATEIGKPKPRSKALCDCIKEFRTQDTNPLRRNLERIADLRDETVHLVIGELPKSVLSLLQAAVLNYHQELRSTFGISLEDRVPLGMMTIVYDISPDKFDLDAIALRRGLDDGAIDYLSEFQTKLYKEIDELSQSPAFAITFEYKLAYVKNPAKADATIGLGGGDKEILEVFVAKPSGISHPYRMVELVEEVNNRTAGTVRVTRHDITAINHCYNIQKRDEYFHQSGITGAPKQYSDRYVEWIIEKASTDANFIPKAREKYSREKISRTGPVKRAAIKSP